MKKVITYGTFDLFHAGHLKLLRRAKELGDYLIVGVTTEHYDVERGKMNVVDSVIKRIDNVRNCGLADEIIVEEHEGQKIHDIQKFGVSIFAVGSDWRGKFDYIKEYCEVVYLERTNDISSSELRAEKQGIVKLGIVGTGRIAKRTMDELRFVSGVNTISVYNPRIKSAEEFAKQFALISATDDFGLFLQAIDAVYIASPHETHYGYTKLALMAGKHVLCEKPLVLKKIEAVELFDMAKHAGLVLMEAIKTAYAPGFLNLLAVAKNGRIGMIRDIEAAFTKLVPEEANTREYNPAIGGSFTELGSYALLPIIKLLGVDYSELRFDRFYSKNSVDAYAKSYLKYNEAIASAKTGIGVKSEGQLLISGSKGYILVKSPWWLIKSFEVCYENPNDNESFSASFPGYGMRFEIADFVRNINNPGMRDYKLSPEDSIAIAGIMEKFLDEGFQEPIRS
ncbi:MAG: Gfo/Idh/MocA family oxidoreductase [Clostridiales bacterium]|nr:Gfo/Idh/MocA family oxidoreductase [Clostridiales bacterium]